jgi:hypothetical protein
MLAAIATVALAVALEGRGAHWALDAGSKSHPLGPPRHRWFHRHGAPKAADVWESAGTNSLSGDYERRADCEEPVYDGKLVNNCGVIPKDVAGGCAKYYRIKSEHGLKGEKSGAIVCKRNKLNGRCGTGTYQWGVTSNEKCSTASAGGKEWTDVRREPSNRVAHTHTHLSSRASPTDRSWTSSTRGRGSYLRRTNLV